MLSTVFICFSLGFLLSMIVGMNQRMKQLNENQNRLVLILKAFLDGLKVTKRDDRCEK